MSRKFLISTLPPALVILTSCGIVFANKKDKQDDVLPETTAPSSEIRWLSPEDPGCIDGGTSLALDNVTIYEWDGSQTAPKVVSFSGNNGSEKDFTSTNILGAAINFTKNYKCTYNDAGERKCVNATKGKTDLKLLRICRANGTYGRDSIEAMTLTAMHYTESAYNFYNSIDGKLSGISKSILISQPKITREITKPNGEIKNRVDSDNAAFADLPASDGKPSYGIFMVYPTTNKWFNKNKNNLWEIPFVMHHEFGHHVFNHYVKDKADSVGLRLRASDGLESILPTRDRSSSRSLKLTTSTDTAQLGLDGINETFADLYGYFAGSSAANQLKGVECLAVSRDPSSSVTKGGMQKGISRSQIDIYEGRSSSTTSTSDCYEPAFDDEHDIAVALGQPLAKFIEALTPQGKGQDRAKYLLVWASRMQTLLNQGRSNVSVDTLVKELILGAKTLSNDTSAACRDLTPRISGLKSAVAACSP